MKLLCSKNKPKEGKIFSLYDSFHKNSKDMGTNFRIGNNVYFTFEPKPPFGWDTDTWTEYSEDEENVWKYEIDEPIKVKI